MTSRHLRCQPHHGSDPSPELFQDYFPCQVLLALAAACAQNVSEIDRERLERWDAVEASRRIAFDLNLRYTLGELNTVKFGDITISNGDGIGVRTARFNLGIAVFP